MMARELITTIEIQADAERVWRILTDFSKYSDWNPFIKKAYGPLQEGRRITVSPQPPGRRMWTFRPRLLKVVPNRELTWLGHTLLPGLADGKHYFVIETVAENRIRLVHGEVFSGLLVPFIWSALRKTALSGFEAMNTELKRVAESENPVDDHQSGTHAHRATQD